MHLETFTVGPFSENTYLLVKDEKALLIDPGFYEDHEFERFIHTLGDTGLDAVVLTHAHIDHLLGLNRVLDKFDVPVYLSDQDRYLWENLVSQALLFGLHVEKVNVIPEPLSVGANRELGPFIFDIRHTPGHAPDHLILYSEEYELVIAGDTLFREGIGRYDLYKGDYRVLEQSIRKQLYTLPPSTKVYPGHGPPTSIGYEKRNNPYIRE